MNERHERLKAFAEKHGRVIAENKNKAAIKEKYKGRDKTKLSKVEADEILVRMAQDLGYLD